MTSLSQSGALKFVFVCFVFGLIESFSTNISADERPNVLWIYVDDMSDWLGCYGDSFSRTPRLDALAENGVLFENAFVPAPVCSTTRSALITGTMQTTLGLHQHRTMIKKRLPNSIQTVPEIFQKAGYLTFNEAKDDYNFVVDRTRMYSKKFKRPKIKSHAGMDYEWLAQLKSNQPFFGQIQLKGGKIGGETGAKFPTRSRFDPSQVTVPPQYPDHPVFRDAIARHYEQIAITDEQVGAILDALKRFEILDQTVVFFFTDHGSPLPRAKQFLYDEGTKVPLIVHWPNGIETIGRRGMRRTDLVSGIDITATSLGIAGIEIPDYMEGRDFLRNEYEPRDFVITARDRMGNAIDRIRAVRTDRYLYIRNFKTDRALFQPNYREKYATFQSLNELLGSGKLTAQQVSYFDAKNRPSEELYELATDPHQITNLLVGNDSKLNSNLTEALQKHRDYLDFWIKETGDQGQYPESQASLRKVYESSAGRCVGPEYEFIRQSSRSR